MLRQDNTGDHVWRSVDAASTDIGPNPAPSIAELQKKLPADTRSMRDRIRWIVDRLPQSTRWFIIDAEAVTTIDGIAAAVLTEISDELSRRNLRLGVVNLHAQLRELLARSGFLARIGPEMSFTRIEDATLAFKKAQ